MADEAEEYCEWICMGDTDYGSILFEASCGADFLLMDMDHKAMDYFFCPFCGDRIEEVK